MVNILSEIKGNLAVVGRNAGILMDRLTNADLNLSDERRILNMVKKAKKMLSDSSNLI